MVTARINAVEPSYKAAATCISEKQRGIIFPKRTQRERRICTSDPYMVLGIFVGPGIQQHLHTVRMTGLRGSQQRRMTELYVLPNTRISITESHKYTQKGDNACRMSNAYIGFLNVLTTEQTRYSRLEIKQANGPSTDTLHTYANLIPK